MAQKRSNPQKKNNQTGGSSRLSYFLILFVIIAFAVKRNDFSNEGSSTRKEDRVTVHNIKEYYGYGDDTVVIDCSDCSTPSETGAKVKTALMSCPKRILIWDEAFLGRAQDHPYMYGCFWVENAGYANSFVNGTLVGVMEPVYTVKDPGEIARMQREIDAAAQEILAKCPGGWDYFGSCKVIHDELIKRNTYDHSLSLPHIFDIYGALVTGNAVCQGYAYAFSYLTDLLGYDSVVVVSDTHAWNMMNSPIDSNERFVDVTWDDKDYKDSRGNESICYDYFGLTKEEVEAVDNHAIVGINGTQQPTIDDHQPFNYHEMYGYVITDYSYDEVVRILRMQKMSNGNTATIRFLNNKAWNAAKDHLLSSNGSLGNALNDAYGSAEEYVYWANDAVMVLDIGVK